MPTYQGKVLEKRTNELPVLARRRHPILYNRHGEYAVVVGSHTVVRREGVKGRVVCDTRYRT